MAPRSRSVYGMEFGRTALCVAQYQSSDHAVTNVAVELLEGSGADWWGHLQDTLKTLAGTMRLGGQDAVCSIPAETAVIKSLMVDKDDPDPVETVRWEVSQHIMGSRDEYAVDSEVLSPGLAFEPARRLVVACRKAAVLRITTLLRSLRIRPVVVDVDLFAALNVFEANYRENVATPSLVVLGGGDCTKVALVADGLFMDWEYFGNDEELTDPEQYAAAIRDGCARLRLADGSPASALAMYVSGPAFANEDFAVRCLRELGRAELLDPFRTIACKAAIAADTLRMFSPQLAVAVGLALRGVRL